MIRCTMLAKIIKTNYNRANSVDRSQFEWDDSHLSHRPPAIRATYGAMSEADLLEHGFRFSVQFRWPNVVQSITKNWNDAKPAELTRFPGYCAGSTPSEFDLHQRTDKRLRDRGTAEMVSLIHPFVSLNLIINNDVANECACDIIALTLCHSNGASHRKAIWIMNVATE